MVLYTVDSGRKRSSRNTPSQYLTLGPSSREVAVSTDVPMLNSDLFDQLKDIINFV